MKHKGKVMSAVFGGSVVICARAPRVGIALRDWRDPEIGDPGSLGASVPDCPAGWA